MEYESYCCESPFDPDLGLAFKVGRSFGLDNKDSEIKNFEKNFGIILPADFVSLIGDWCEGGFDGFYRVAKERNFHIVWSHLLQMKLSDHPIDPSHHPNLSLKRYPTTFFSNNKLVYFPFGEACYWSDNSNEDHSEGFLAFDLLNQNKIRYLDTQNRNILIADSFSAMVMQSTLLQFG